MRLEHLLSGEMVRTTAGPASVTPSRSPVTKDLTEYEERRPRLAPGAAEAPPRLAPAWQVSWSSQSSDMQISPDLRRHRAPRRRGFSSAGRAPALQAGGQRFESVILHDIEVIDMLGTRRVKRPALRGRRVLRNRSEEIELKEQSSDKISIGR